MPTLGRDGVELAYDDSGEQDLPPVVFLHGLSGARTTWARVASTVVGRCRVLALDQRGHGESSHAPGTYDLLHYGADTTAFCDTLGRTPAVLVGHSLGGVIAAFVAQTRPDLVRGVLLEDPPLYRNQSPDGERGRIAAMFPMLRRVLREMRERGGTLEQYEAMVRGAPALNGTGGMAEVLGPQGTRAQARALMNVDPEVFTPAIEGSALAGLDPSLPLACPTRVIRADPALGAAFSPQDEERFLSTNRSASVEVFEGASHAVHDEQPERFVAEVHGFLARLGIDRR